MKPATNISGNILTVLRRWRPVTGLALWMAMTGAAMPVSADVDRGREVAATHCTRCHVVGNINP
jgi:mono/diheme cytochrome c family protein